MPIRDSRLENEVWDEFFEAERSQLRLADLDTEYARLWGRPTAPTQALSKPSYKDFGDAPDNDPAELKMFARRVRRGQKAFRDNLIKAYGGKCCVTGHGLQVVLEAAHVADHAKSASNKLDNGLLLRADLHTLVDDGLLRINPDTLTVAIDPKIKGTPYWDWDLNGKNIAARIDGTKPHPKYLKLRWEAYVKPKTG